MAFDDDLACRVRAVFKQRSFVTEEKRMMGGLCFMVDRKMCIGIAGSRLMVRLDPAIYEESLRKPGCEPMDFTGKPMRGFVFIRPDSVDSARALGYWIDLALDFNPRAKSSRARKATKNSLTRNPKPASTARPKKRKR